MAASVAVKAIMPVNITAFVGTPDVFPTIAKIGGKAFSLAPAYNILEDPNKQPIVDVPVAVRAPIAINTAPTPGRTFSIANDNGAAEAAKSTGEADDTTPYPVATYRITTVTSAETCAKGRFFWGLYVSSPKVN